MVSSVVGYAVTSRGISSGSRHLENWIGVAWREIGRKVGSGYVVRLVSHYRGLEKKKGSISAWNGRKDNSRRVHLPQIILLDRTDSVDRSNIRLDTKDLQSQTSTLLNHLIGVVSVLWRDGVGLPFDIGWNVLIERLVLIVRTAFEAHTFRAMKTDRGPANVKIPLAFTEVTIAST